MTLTVATVNGDYTTKAVKREEGEENKESLGTVFYAISLFILALITFGPLDEPLIGLCGIFVMGYGDGFAAVIGQAVKSKEYVIKGNTKSIAGSLTMFVITLMIISLLIKKNYFSILIMKKKLL